MDIPMWILKKGGDENWHIKIKQRANGLHNAQGLIPKGRLYVHLSTDIETARKVGSRHGMPVIYQIDCSQMVKDGLFFYLSANDIWLTEEVPVRYLKKCVNM